MKLENAIRNLQAWARTERKAGRSTDRRCLEAVRKALDREGLHLPYGNGVDYSGNTALENWVALTANPSRWGWKAVHHQNGVLPQPCLVYFKNCGKLRDGRTAGHIAILCDGRIYANSTYKYGKYWKDRIVGAFIPEADET